MIFSVRGKSGEVMFVKNKNSFQLRLVSQNRDGVRRFEAVPHVCAVLPELHVLNRNQFYIMRTRGKCVDGNV